MLVITSGLCCRTHSGCHSSLLCRAGFIKAAKTFGTIWLIALVFTISCAFSGLRRPVPSVFVPECINSYISCDSAYFVVFGSNTSTPYLFFRQVLASKGYWVFPLQFTRLLANLTYLCVPVNCFWSFIALYVCMFSSIPVQKYFLSELYATNVTCVSLIARSIKMLHAQPCIVVRW